MSIMAATLANGGMNPLTSKRVFSPLQVRCALPLMLSSGMYDYSGQWSYDIGVPAKSGVGGCVFMVIPNLCGIAIWSPRLDEIGNSARGVHVAQELVKVFSFHNFEVFSGLSQTKIDPTKRKGEAQQKALGAILFAASMGDMTALASYLSSNVNIYESDYDQRTALHLAAAEGHVDAVRFLIENCPADRKAAILSAPDRWGGTPLDDAITNEHEEIVNMLSIAGAQSGASQNHVEPSVTPHTSEHAGSVIFAAANDELDTLITQFAIGKDLFCGDYDFRTAIHLAASNGNIRCLSYLLAKARKADCLSHVLSVQDRWGGTPLADALRGGHQACVDLLNNAN
jgi:glutaminase